MNLTNLILWSAGIVTALAGAQNIDTIQHGIFKAQARLVYASRTETWGSPQFLAVGQRNRHRKGKNVLKNELNVPSMPR